MLISKYCSSKEVIDSVYLNTGASNEVPVIDLITHIYDCMEKIGYPLQYIEKVVGWKQREDYDFSAYKIQLPCDFHKLRTILVNGFPAIPSNDTMLYLLDGACCGLDNLQDQTLTPVFTDNFGVTFGSDMPPVSANFPYIGLGRGLPITFSMNNNWMTFNVKKGKACMAYKAFPIDGEGFPLIPDDVKYKDAITKYLIERVDYILYRQGMITKDIYEDSQTKWFWAAGACSNNLKIPDALQTEGLKRQLIRMIPQFEEFYNNFRGSNRDTNRH